MQKSNVPVGRECFQIQRVLSPLPPLAHFVTSNLRLLQTETAVLRYRSLMTTYSAQDEQWMRVALEEAAKAPLAGEIPIGAVIVRDGEIVAKAHNYRELWQDPTAHAEVVAIRTAASALGSWRLTDTTLYVTLEPCAMCIGAIILARVPRLVFGAHDPKAGACGSLFDLSGESRLNHRVLVTGGVLEEECQVLLQGFFRRLRAEEVQPNSPST